MLYSNTETIHKGGFIVRIKRMIALLLAVILATTALPVSVSAAGNDRTVVGFEINNPEEIPALVMNPHAGGMPNNRYCAHNALGYVEFLVTYSDGTKEIAYVYQKIGDDFIEYKPDLSGPDGDVNRFVFTLGKLETSCDVEFAESPVESLEVLTEPTLTLGEDAAVTTIGPMRGLMLDETYACDYEGLSFRINYLDGTSRVVNFSELVWPDHAVYSQFQCFPKYNRYNVEVQAYIPEVGGEGYFNYWSGKYFPQDTTNGIPMIMHYMGKIVTFNLKVQEGPVAKVVYQPNDVTADASTEAVFEVGATGPNLVYQWQYRTGTSASWKNCTEDGKNWDYTVEATSETDGWQFRCKVTDSNGVVAYSEPATLTVNYPVKIVNNGRYALKDLSVGADGVYRTPNGFKVYIALHNVVDGGLQWLGGHTLYEYVESYGQMFDLTYWDELVALMDDDGYVELTEQTLQYLITTISGPWGESEVDVPWYLAYDYAKGTPLKITKQPEDVTVAAGEEAVVTVEAVGDGLTYAWYFKNPGASKFSLTTTFTGNTYSVNLAANRSGRQVYCVITDKYGNSVTTDTVTLTVASKTELKITKQPEDVTVAAGEKAVVTVEAQGDGLTYKWYFKNPGASKFSLTTSFKSNTYSVVMSDARNGRQIYCVITDQYGNSVTTDTVVLTME